MSSALGLRGPEITCTLAVRELESATIKQVAEKTSADANRVLKKLCKLGVLEKAPLIDPNRSICGRRPNIYTLSDRGYALAEHLFHARLVLLELQQRRAGIAQAGDAACHPTN